MPKKPEGTIYVALLRGINVGGNNKVSMSELKQVFEKLGFLNVRTYINSGNVIFETAEKDSVRGIEKAIEKAFGFKVSVLVRTAQNIQKLCKEIPSEYTNDTARRTDVVFLWDDYDSKKTISLIKHSPDIDTLLYIKGAIVWSFKREHYKKSGLHKFIGTEVYKNMTARNVNTVRKLGELMKST